MFHSTTAENFQSWDKFLDAYYEPIKAALGLMPFVGADRAEDVAHNFFLKLYQRQPAGEPADDHRAVPRLAVHRGPAPALDELRKLQRRRERPDAFEIHEPADPRRAPGGAPFDADECYALSVLQ